MSLYKLMAYKDEYEVARLYVESGFMEKVARDFEGPAPVMPTPGLCRVMGAEGAGHVLV